MLACVAMPLAVALPLAEPRAMGFSEQRLSMMDNIMRQYVDDGRVPGYVAAVARGGQLVHLSANGWQDVAAEVPMAPDTIFEIRSMSKPITAVAVMQLVEQGKLGLEDLLSDHIPSFANMRVFTDPANPDDGLTRQASRPITIEDLLLHQSGLSHRLQPLYSSRQVRSRADTLEQLVEKVAAVPLIADPGTLWNYSIGTTVLGRIVELVSGQRFDEYLQANVFTPLAMHDTGFYIPADRQHRRAIPYQVAEARDAGLQPLPEMPVPIIEPPALLEGAAGMVSTVPDYLRFLQAMLNQGELDGQRVLSAQSVVLLTENRLRDELLPFQLGGNELPALGWGYGFSVVIDPAVSAFGVNRGEFGWNGSLGTFSWADPGTDTISILMMQISPAGAFNLSALFKSLTYQAGISQ